MPDNNNYIKLSELARRIQRTIADNFANRQFWVICELSNLKHYPLKNYYFFDLVEKDPLSNNLLTSIKATAWNNAVARISYFEQVTGQRFDNNIQVLLSVSVEYHITYGLKLNVLDVDPSFTLGNLERQRQRTLERLAQQNSGFIRWQDGQYYTYNKSLKLNPVLQKIALIASVNSDGYRDFKHELEHNNFGYRFSIDEYPAQVQGANADTQMVSRLIEVFTSGIPYDAVVLVRGGGAQSDFLAFDSYELARAIAKFPMPVFTGIGHTRNESIADLMAFGPAKTPTKVAEVILSHNRLFEEKIIHLRKHIVAAANAILAANKLSLSEGRSLIHTKSKELLYLNFQELGAVKSSVGELAMRKIIASRQAVARYQAGLNHITTSLVTKHRFRLDGYTQLVKHLSPQAVLRRGYALVRQNGLIITSADKIAVGSEITTELGDIALISTVKEKRQTNE